MLTPLFVLPYLLEGSLMKYATRASAEALVRKTIDHPIGDTLYRLREMSGTERDRFEMSVFKPAGTNGAVPSGVVAKEVDPLYLRARMVVMCWVGEDNKRLYKDSEVQLLSDTLPASILAELFTESQKLNGMAPTSVEDAAKNSASAPAGASTSVSPGTSKDAPSLNS